MGKGRKLVEGAMQLQLVVLDFPEEIKRQMG